MVPLLYNQATLASGGSTLPPKLPNKDGRIALTIKELPPDGRPREKLKALGAGALSEAELLAIILRVGTQGESVIDLANRLLVTYGGLVGLSRVSFAELCDVHGLGEAKACQLKSALELGRRLLFAGAFALDYVPTLAQSVRVAAYSLP